LNGASSTGKTTLARLTRDLLGVGAVALSLDDLYPTLHRERRNDWPTFVRLGNFRAPRPSHTVAMRRVVSVLALFACAPHEREDSTLSVAPAAQPMPDAPETAANTNDSPNVPTAAAKCDPALADAPTVLFGGRVQVVMPARVEMIEDNPTFASAQRVGGFEVTCGAVLRRAMLILFRSDATASLDDAAREASEALEKNAYVGARDAQWTTPRPDVRRATVRIPALEGQPELELLLHVQRFETTTILLVYEALPTDFARLAPSLHASADSLRVLP